MSWKDDISRCFGIVDKRFRTHPIEEKKAKELLARLKKENVTWLEVKAEFEAFLDSTECDFEHYQNEMQKVERYFAQRLPQ